MNYQPLDVETLDYVVAVKQELKLDAELGPILVRLVDLKERTTDVPFHEFQDFTRKRKDYEKLLPTVMTMIGFFSEDPLNVLQRVQQRFELETIGSAGLLLAVLFKEHPEQCLSFVSTLLKPSVEPAVETKQSIPRISLKELPAKFQNVREANVLSLLHELLIKYHNERVFKYHEDEKPRLRISEPRLFKISVTLDGKVIGESNFEKNKKKGLRTKEASHKPS